MFGNIKQLFLLIIFLVPASCTSIFEDMPRCELWLKFVFDHNMEYADSFSPQVKSVDVFVFDSNDKLLFTKRTEAAGLVNGNRMPLADDLAYGKYKVLTLGGLSDNFRVSDYLGQDVVPGVTTLQQFMFALERRSDEVNFEFPHLYLGEALEIDYSPENADHKVYQVNLMRITNRFNIMLVSLNGAAPATEIPPYTFEIVTPESGTYSWENEPLDVTHPVTYSPYYLNRGETSDILVSAHLNTLRLLNREGLDYKIIVRDTKTLNEVWSYNLLTLLLYTKPINRHDGTALPFQEYLDREGEWNLIFCVTEKDPGSGNAFLSIGLQIADWIYWLQDIEIE